MPTYTRYAMLSAMLLVGCAIRPEPANYARVSTFQIVKQIRCETRSAAMALALLHAAANGPENKAVAARFAGAKLSLVSFTPDTFSGRARDNIALFWNSGVAYNFSLEMTETNNLGADLGFMNKLMDRTLDLGVKVGLDRQRQNTRSFTITDRIGDLVRDMTGENGCDADAAGPNYLYPMAGEIGVRSMLQSFVFMTLFNNLGGYQDKVDPTKRGGPPTMVDSLEFETTVYGDATPKIDFSPVGDGFELVNASLTSTNRRKDRHRVVMGIALVGLADEKLEQVRGRYVGKFITASGRNGAEIAAAVAVDQVITESALSRVILLDR